MYAPSHTSSEINPLEQDEIALVNCATRPQVTDGTAVCTGFAVCDSSGNRTWKFPQGARAHLRYEFTLLDDLDGVIFAGAELCDSNGVVVHGKNTLQSDPPLTFPGVRGSLIRVHQWLDLRVSPGDYHINVGLAGTDPQAFADYTEGRMSHEAIAGRVRERCRLLEAGSLNVGYAEGGKLTHHGVADLPGSFSAWQRRGDISNLPTLRQEREGPTIFHVTHWKAGSQWIAQILQECAPGATVAAQVDDAQVLYYPIRRGHVYPTVYLAKPDFDRIALPQDSRVFVVIRDLRDTLISSYFSFKLSHPIMDSNHIALREALHSRSKEDGLLLLMENFAPLCAKIQLSWHESGACLLKYEDLLDNDVSLLEEVLIGRCGLALDPPALREIVLANRFAAQTKGRVRGVEDTWAHNRKGIAGDWRNHFTLRLKKAFKARFGGLLVETGYERDLDW